MGLIFLFRRLVYVQVLLGIVAFCMAERNPGLLLVAGAIGALSWYVVEGPAGRPLPQWTIMLGACASVGWLLADLIFMDSNIIVAMGHFTMWLQVLLLYSRKSNREYGEILVLSLLQMIGASVISISMIYALLLIGYCVLALFSVLLFQLKITSDLVLEAIQAGAPAGVKIHRPAPVVGRSHRWHFRLMTLTIGIVCTAVGLLVFIIAPRSSNANLNKYLLPPAVDRQVGFNSRIELGSSQLIGNNSEPAMHLTLSLNGRELTDDEPGWLLRGAALDHYDATTRTWSRGRMSNYDSAIDLPPEGRSLLTFPSNASILEARVILRNNTQRHLFSLYPPIHIRSEKLRSVLFNPRDCQLANPDIASGVTSYVVRSPLLVGENVPQEYAVKAVQGTQLTTAVELPQGNNAGGYYASGWHPNVDAIRDLTLKVIRDAGLDRPIRNSYEPQDEQIANILVNYLRSNYAYSLTPAPRSGTTDPIAVFLFKSRQGHCELFASALAAMTRSLGMRTRLVTGYRCGEYNRLGGYYLIRQSDAHAWCEIDLGEHGWRSFDPTPPASLLAQHASGNSWFRPLSELYEHLEFTWMNFVVSYDRSRRDRVISDTRAQFEEVARAQTHWLLQIYKQVSNFTSQFSFDGTSLVIIIVIGFFIIVGIASLIRMAVIRRRRLVALQLTAMPRKQRRGLVRQLRFYLTMLDLLEHHGHIRPAWQSPFSFAKQLATTNPARFDPVISLTEVFYEIRFGHRNLDQERQQRVDQDLRTLAAALAHKHPSHGPGSHGTAR